MSAPPDPLDPLEPIEPGGPPPEAGGPPDLPTIDHEIADVGDLAGEIWELALKSHGAVRIRLGAALFVDVFEAAGDRRRQVVIWRAGDVPRAGWGSAMRTWTAERDGLWQTLSEKMRLKRRDWREGPPNRGYPARAVRYSLGPIPGGRG